jgi:uncharacterized membrane protein HdeD (DUF308 family)
LAFEEDEEMVFRRHSPARHSERSSTATQGERSVPPQQYERAGTARQAAGTPRGATRTGGGLPGGWVAELLLGLATLVLGLIVAAHPMHSLTVLAVLLGVLMIISGVFHVVRSLEATSEHRTWRAIGGVLFFLAGIFLLRHTQLTLSIIALFAGFAFIMAGIAALADAVSGDSLIASGWSVLFGLICLGAGIAAIVAPINSLTTLAIVLGWSFAAIGIVHMIGAVVTKLALRKQPKSGQVSVPGQRATEATDAEGAYGAPPAAPGRRSSRP